MIPYGRQDITKEDIDSVVEVLGSDWLTTGPNVKKFEEAVGKYTQSQCAVAFNSATSALHAACEALGLGKGDWLWTVPNTFVASANCGVYLGAQVDFVDIDPKTYNMCPVDLATKLESAKAEGCLPKVVIPVHFSGQSCDMKAIKKLADQYGFHIIEDASHAIGAEYNGKPVGSCEYSDIAVFSFHPVKIITTGEGGLATTNSPELFEKMNLFRSHGVTRSPDLMQGESDGPWYYQQVSLGFNYRITDIQCALGTSQMQRLDEYISQRRSLAARYSELLCDLPLILPYQDSEQISAWHLYVIQVDTLNEGPKRRQVFETLREKGIGVNVHYIPVHTQPFYKNMGFAEGQFPESERYYSRAISLPMYATLTEEQQDHVIHSLKEILG